MFASLNVLACAISLTCTGAQDTFEPKDVFDLEYAAAPAISPDGQSVAYQRISGNIQSDRFRSSIWKINLTPDTPTHRPVIQGPGSYSNPVWSPSGDRLLFTASQSGKTQLRVLFTDTLQSATLATLPDGPGAPAWSPDGNWIIFSMFVEDTGPTPAALPAKPNGAQWAPPVKVIEQVQYRNDGAGYAKTGSTQVFILDADGGTPRQVTRGPVDHPGPFAWTPSGDVILSTNTAEDADLDPVESNLYQLSIETGELTQLTDRDGTERAPVISPDGSQIAYVGFDDLGLGSHTRILSVLDLRTGKTRDLTKKLDRNVGAVRFAPDSDEIWFTYSDHGIGRVASIDASSTVKEHAINLGGTTLGRPYASGAYSVGPDGLFAYTVTNPTRPGDLVITSTTRGELFRTRLNEDLLAHKSLPDAQLITAKSVGELTIEGWLVLPPDHEPGDKHPMILEIHGGPFADYGPRFSAEVQLYAAAGYAVLYSNPRGSTSYGADFVNEIHLNYPGQDYDDLMAITDAAIATGNVDADRLFVTGGSGGGVLTAWIVGKTDRFRAAVVAKPVINWISFSLTADAYTFFSKYWFAAMAWEDPMAFWKRSPLSLVGNVSTPTMLLSGEADYRTPISESEQYYQALRLRGVPTRMVRIPEASHGIASRPSHLIAKVAEILRWFEEHDTPVED